MGKILGLDLGTNSIGWALIDDEEKRIVKAGSRIIPMDAATLSAFETGNLQSPASVRTGFRGTRRLYQRAELRRERLLRVLHLLGFLPEHFKSQIDFTEHPGQFINHGEPLLPYCKNTAGKNEFIFMDAFNEMLADFQLYHPELVADGRKVPYDWTIYYLRKKALKKAITREELAWIILNFNTKRGYYQLRGKDEAAANKNEEYAVLTVEQAEKTGANKQHHGCKWYEITYGNGATQRKSGPEPPRKPGDKVELIITTTLDKDGNVKLNKEGQPTVKLRDPKEGDWTLMKKRTEAILNKSQETVGSYIYDSILANPTVKVRGKLVHTIERKYYRDELRQILDTQTKFIPELSNRQILAKCINDLYHQNEAHRSSLADKSITDFIIDDIIFYQRPLKSKKNEVADCPFEYYVYKDPKTDEQKRQHLKCVAKSNPYYQEFRLWQFIQDLHIYQRQKEVNGKLKTDVDVTSELITSEDDIVALFDWLNERKEVSQEQLLKSPVLNLGNHSQEYRWNYVESKSYPCNETHYEITKRMKEVEGCPHLSFSQEMDLWHILYSVEDIIDLDKALHHFAHKNNIDEDSFARLFVTFEPFEDDYGAYSEKAIKRLLTLMRCGKYWDQNNIDTKTQTRIEHIINGEVDESISMQVRKKALSLKDTRSFRYLPLWLASYVIYNRHSEATDISVWKKPEDIDDFLRHDFRQHSLRNPIVEMVLGETIRIVRDIWKMYGKISEVHIEMARELKQAKEKRQRTALNMLSNQRTNFRIKLLLQEFASPEYKIEDVRPQSLSQQEIFKIFESYALENGQEVPDDIQVIVDNLGNPSKHVSGNEIMRYRLWLEQQYLSPYTGQPIPLSKLFTTAYEIEHVIPQSRYYDDSLSNKVICESEVNKDKGRMLGYEYILKNGGKIVNGTGGRRYKILDHIQYEEFVKKHYTANYNKMRKLLMDDIPDGFILRQLNDSRYIARKALEILSHLVREQGEETAVSKHIIATNGRITDQLKKDWGLNDVWNDTIAPRFERMNHITGTQDYGGWVSHDGKRFFQTNVPLEISRGFSKKRIDHRHHAMDAIVIACATRDHVNLLNNSAALSDKKDYRYDLRSKLCEKVKTDANGNYVWRFRKPWESFTQDTKNELTTMIVSFKQNLRVINKMTNFYWHYENGKKVLARQTRGDGWAIRRSLHKATVSGAVKLQLKKTERLAVALDHPHLICDKEIRNAIYKVIDLYHGKADNKTLLKYFKDREYKVGNKDISKVEVYYTPDVPELSATRVALTTAFTRKEAESVTDTGIRKILLRHLDKYMTDGKDHPELAFSPDGINDMNEHIKELNDGKNHKSILKVRKTESLGMKFNIGLRGNKDKKFVEADKGTNLFFAVYADSDGSRSFESIPFNLAVEREKNHQDVAPARNEKGDSLLFTLSPNDLVYLPEEGEHVTSESLEKTRIYKFVSCTGNRAFFVNYNVATSILDKVEFTKLNKFEFDNSHKSIKTLCIKLHVDRLGNVTL